MNRATESARGFHDRTAHSPESVRASGHRLVWDIQPSPFKIYADLPPMPLPRDLPALGMDACSALSSRAAGAAPLDLNRLAAILFFSAGIMRTKEYPGGGRQCFRAAPSTGALYQTEIYVVVGAVPDLPAGVYHFSPGDFALRLLRAGDFRGALAVAAADEGIAAAPATIVATAIYWRNTWKYQARGYRHLFWDSGSLLANLLAAATGLDLAARLVSGFVEREVNGLLGVDARGALVLAPLGREGHRRPSPPSSSARPPRGAAVFPTSTTRPARRLRTPRWIPRPKCSTGAIRHQRGPEVAPPPWLLPLGRGTVLYHQRGPEIAPLS
jgi:SagB-type dehydrogenase family enzyme